MNIPDCSQASWRRSHRSRLRIAVRGARDALELRRFGAADIHVDACSPAHSFRDQKQSSSASRSPRSAATATIPITSSRAIVCRSGITFSTSGTAQRHADVIELLHLHDRRRLTTTATAGYRPYTTFSVGAPRRHHHKPGRAYRTATRGRRLQPDPDHARTAAAAMCFPSAAARCRPACRSIRAPAASPARRTPAGTFNFTVSCARQRRQHRHARLFTSPSSSPIIVNPASLPNGTHRHAPTTRPSARAAAPAPYTFAVTAGSLPTGLSLNTTTGAITGTPSAARQLRFHHRGDRIQRQQHGNRPYNVTIGTSAADDQSGEPAGRARWAPLQPDRQRKRRHRANYSYAVRPGALPTGLSLKPAPAPSPARRARAAPSTSPCRRRTRIANIGTRSLHGEHRHQLADGQSGQACRTARRAWPTARP